MLRRLDERTVQEFVIVTPLRSYALAAGAAIGLVALTPSMGSARPDAPAGRSALSASDRALADQAARYLSGLKSAQARFTQTDPRGAVTKGQFTLQRPGKARFAYDAPTDLTVVADGTNVNVYDGRLKTFDQYPLASTPLSLLLASDVRFDNSVAISAVGRDASGFTVTLRDPKKRAEGQLTLSYATTPLRLTGWTVVDGQGQRTTVRLDDLKAGAAIDPKLFVLHNPGPKPFRIRP